MAHAFRRLRPQVLEQGVITPLLCPRPAIYSWAPFTVVLCVGRDNSIVAPEAFAAGSDRHLMAESMVAKYIISFRLYLLLLYLRHLGPSWHQELQGKKKITNLLEIYLA